MNEYEPVKITIPVSELRQLVTDIQYAITPSVYYAEDQLKMAHDAMEVQSFALKRAEVALMRYCGDFVEIPANTPAKIEKV